MLSRKDDAQSFTIPGGTEGRLYPPSPKGDQSIAVVEMDGQYPEKGWSINSKCSETLYVVSGSIELECEGEFMTLNPGDLYVILPDRKYRTKGKGQVIDIITPSWDKNQNKIIE